jgi:hypothetical protein
VIIKEELVSNLEKKILENDNRFLWKIQEIKNDFASRDIANL